MSYKYRPPCPDFDPPPRRFRSKSHIPRHFWTTPDRLFVLCETVLRGMVPHRTKEHFWTVIENLMPPRGRLQLRHHLNDTRGRQCDYLNHWDRLALEIARKTNPQSKYPRIIIGRPSTIPHLHEPGPPFSNSSTTAKIRCSIKEFRFCEIQVQNTS